MAHHWRITAGQVLAIEQAVVIRQQAATDVITVEHHQARVAAGVAMGPGKTEGSANAIGR